MMGKGAPETKSAGNSLAVVKMHFLKSPLRKQKQKFETLKERIEKPHSHASFF